MRSLRFHPGFRGRSRAGFTLIEVLATLVLIAIVLPAAMYGISLALGMASIARTSAEAASLAEAKLGEIIALGQWNSGALAGDFGENWPGYQWTAESIETQTDLMQITVTVSWTSRGQERSLELSTLMYTGAALSTFGESAFGPL